MKAWCPNCGVKFSSSVIDSRRKDGKPFYCPNGHAQSFAAVVAKEREAAAAEAQRVQDEVAQLEALYVRTPTLKEWAVGAFAKRSRVGRSA